jgi:hypothetical protein
MAAKLFLTWSGSESREIASTLRTFFQDVLHPVEVFFSEEDIEKGSIWIEELNRHIKESQYCIVCLTNENKNNPWIIFEAGALSNGIARQKVIPCLVNMKLTELEPPLSLFQAITLEKDAISKVVFQINGVSESPKSDDQLRRIFDVCYPDLQTKIDQIREKFSGIAPLRSLQKPTISDIASSLENLFKLMQSIDGKLSAKNIDQDQTRQLEQQIELKDRSLRTVASRSLKIVRLMDEKQALDLEQLRSLIEEIRRSSRMGLDFGASQLTIRDQVTASTLKWADFEKFIKEIDTNKDSDLWDEMRKFSEKRRYRDGEENR